MLKIHNGDTNLQQPLIFTTLSRNLSTICTHTSTLTTHYPKVNFSQLLEQKLIDLESIVDRENMFGRIDSVRASSGDKFVVYYGKDQTSQGKIVILTITDSDADQSLVFSILNDILIAFREYNLTDGVYPDYGTSSDDQQGTIAFETVMEKIIEDPRYRDLLQNNSVRLANQEINQMKTLMNDNIERVLQRGERIHLLVNKTDKLNNASNSFRRRTVAIRRKFWWKNVRLLLIGSLVGIIVLYLLGGEFCGLPGYAKCFRKGDDNE